MEGKEILIIRRAKPEDIDLIWNLLHASSIGWSDDTITIHLNQLLVLQSNNRLLGVLYASNNASESIHWVVIHPMYPEKMLHELMLSGFNSLTSVSSRLNQLVPSPV